MPYELTIVMYNKNCVDPDQLASEEASSSGSTQFSIEFISDFILFLKSF